MFSCLTEHIPYIYNNIDPIHLAHPKVLRVCQQLNVPDLLNFGIFMGC